MKVLFDPFECKGGYARNFKEHAEYLYMGYPLLVTLITKRTYYVFNSLSKIVWYGTNWVLGYFMSHYLYVSPPWKPIEGGLEGLTKDQPSCSVYCAHKPLQNSNFGSSRGSSSLAPKSNLDKLTTVIEKWRGRAKRDKNGCSNVCIWLTNSEWEELYQDDCGAMNILTAGWLIKKRGLVSFLQYSSNFNNWNQARFQIHLSGDHYYQISDAPFFLLQWNYPRYRQG